MVPVTIADVRQAAARIEGVVRRTYLEESRPLSRDFGCELWFKLECLQPTGSFKLRGAANKLTMLAEQRSTSPVLTVSAGNHGLAVAHCAASLGLQATVIVP